MDTDIDIMQLRFLCIMHYASCAYICSCVLVSHKKKRERERDKRKK